MERKTFNHTDDDLHEASQAEIDRLTAELEKCDGQYDTLVQETRRLTAERDTALAQVAAAFETAERALEARKYGDPDEREEYAFDAALDRGIVAIRKLTPADASDALSRLLDEAYAAGQARMREAAAVKCYVDKGRFDTPDRIRALPITPRPDRGIGRDDLHIRLKDRGW